MRTRSLILVAVMMLAACAPQEPHYEVAIRDLEAETDETADAPDPNFNRCGATYTNQGTINCPITWNRCEPGYTATATVLRPDPPLRMNYDCWCECKLNPTIGAACFGICTQGADRRYYIEDADPLCDTGQVCDYHDYPGDDQTLGGCAGNTFGMVYEGTCRLTTTQADAGIIAL